MMTRWIIWPLILSFCIQALGQTLILGRFYLHQEAIERTRCENRLKPELQCHGKCQLKKELANTSDEQSRTIPEIRDWVLDLPEQPVELHAEVGRYPRMAFRILSPISIHHLPGVFHPPCA